MPRSRTFKGVLANADDIAIDFWLPGMSTHHYSAPRNVFSNINSYCFEDLRKKQISADRVLKFDKQKSIRLACVSVDWQRFFQFLVGFL